MKIRFDNRFNKDYSKLKTSIKEKVDETIELFIADPFHRQLKNHALKGKMKGKRAISVTGNIRIIFKIYDDYLVVIFLGVGSHNQVY